MPPTKYTSYSASKAQRSMDVAMMQAADRATRQASYRKAITQRSGYGSVARARGAAVQGEMKYFDCDRSPTTLTITTTTWPAGTIVDPGTTINLGDAAVANPLCLFVPKVSAALNGRIGRKVRVHKIRVTGQITTPIQAAQAGGDAATQVRLLLVMDTQTNSAQMTSAALLNDGTAAATTLQSFQNPNNFGRFRVLKQKYFNITAIPGHNDAAATGVVYGTLKSFKLSYRFKTPVLVNFNATNGGTVADIIDNSFHIICGTSNTDLAPSINYYSRVTYKE